MAPIIGFSSLPSELIVRILCYLNNVKDVLDAGLVAREVHDCSLENSVWRSIYHQRWKYGRHQKSKELLDWRKEYMRRHQIDGWIDDSVEKLIYPPEPPNHARIPRYRESRKWGIDMKDRLLHHVHCDDDAVDVLARRYWARTMLTNMYRRQALATWRDLNDGKDVLLEQAVCAFEHFISDDETGDYESTANQLDAMALDFKQTQAEYVSLDTRGRALLLAHYMVNLNGFGGVAEYFRYDVRNNFIGLTLSSPTREGLPINYAVIYCALARRIGLDAQPCNYPGHIYVVVNAPPGVDLDGKPVKKDATSLTDRMYLDLYALDGLEVPETTLRSRLMTFPNFHPNDYEESLQPASVLSLTTRVRSNLFNSYQRAMDDDFRQWPPDNQNFLNNHRENIMYSVVWMHMLLTGHGAQVMERQRRHVGYLLQPLQRHFPNDWYLFEEFIMPIFRDEQERQALQSELRVMRLADQAVVEPKRREPSEHEQPIFKIGVCFVHRRYGYTGMIIGWDEVCKAPEVWQRQQRIDELDNGRSQCFYNIVSADGTDRYVAQENIGPTPPEGPSDALLRLAGRYFLRWDSWTSRFTSNLKTQYPDD